MSNNNENNPKVLWEGKVSERLRKEHGIEDFDLANRIYKSACDVSKECAVTIQYAYSMIALSFKLGFSSTSMQ